jgi:hypothetical protein
MKFQIFSQSLGTIVNFAVYKGTLEMRGEKTLLDIVMCFIMDDYLEKITNAALVTAHPPVVVEFKGFIEK